jgi:hypothetical protein
MMHNASKIANYSLTMSIIKVKQFVNAVIYSAFGFSRCISLAIMHAAASCCTPTSDKKHWDGSFLFERLRLLCGVHHP